MIVKELIKRLQEMNPNAEVYVISQSDIYLKVIDVEEEYSDLVSLGLKK